MSRLIASMISKDGRQIITVSEEGQQRSLVLTGPDVLTGQFTLNLDLQTAEDLGRALWGGQKVAHLVARFEAAAEGGL